MGHCTSENMVDWKQEGAALYPDSPFDCHGVYSGNVLVEDGRMYLYYTGNVKLDGDYDYIHTGRESNTVLTISEDGKTFGPKKVLMQNCDYPEFVTCHVRDPRVWKEGDRYYMIQGARTKEDQGTALLFVSSDKENWTYSGQITTREKFGCMWECPEYLKIGRRKVLSASVQGLTGGEWKNRNVYQSGYFFVEGDFPGDCQLSEYYLWDYGFDFYAPQSFRTEDGRMIQIGWMGMPDCPQHINKTLADNWQHCFTFPREITQRDGMLLQNPVRELREKKEPVCMVTGNLHKEGIRTFEVDTEHIIDSAFRAVLAGELVLEYRDGFFRMYFLHTEKEAVSGGRDMRCTKLPELTDVKILADVSSVEVFLNGGEAVFSTRYYPDTYCVEIQAPGADIQFWNICHTKL
jgi:beta-fructofuranosidase